MQTEPNISSKHRSALTQYLYVYQSLKELTDTQEKEKEVGLLLVCLYTSVSAHCLAGLTFLQSKFVLDAIFTLLVLQQNLQAAAESRWQIVEMVRHHSCCRFCRSGCGLPLPKEHFCVAHLSLRDAFSLSISASAHVPVPGIAQ